MTRISQIEKETARAHNEKLPIPTPEQALESFKVNIKDFPDITPKQALAIELMMDYVIIQEPIKIRPISDRVHIHDRTLRDWITKDINFRLAVQAVNQHLGNAGLDLAIGRLSVRQGLEAQINSNEIDLLSKLLGRSQPETVNVVNITLESGISKDSGEIIWARRDASSSTPPTLPPARQKKVQHRPSPALTEGSEKDRQGG